jgi:hypothetical protein
MLTLHPRVARAAELQSLCVWAKSPFSLDCTLTQCSGSAQNSRVRGGRVASSTSLHSTALTATFFFARSTELSPGSATRLSACLHRLTPTRLSASCVRPHLRACLGRPPRPRWVLTRCSRSARLELNLAAVKTSHTAKWWKRIDSRNSCKTNNRSPKEATNCNCDDRHIQSYCMTPASRAWASE